VAARGLDMAEVSHVYNYSLLMESQVEIEEYFN